MHSKYIGMGSSLSIIFLYDHFQQLSLVLGSFECTSALARMRVFVYLARFVQLAHAHACA